HFQRDIILWAVRWYCKYGISYRELQEMLAERGVNVDHSTIYRWVQRYAPEMEKRLRWYWRNPSDLCPWHMDETYVKVNGRWAYLYRAVDSRGRTVDFYLSSRRNSKAAYRFLGKILNNVKKWQIPRFINTDKGHCCKVSDEAAFCLIQRPYISKTLLTRRISPRGSP
ncbi:transposase IS66 family protein, partial [Escherichia coli 6-175-07_S3_C1]